MEKAPVSEENTLVAEPIQAIPADNNWVDGISSSQSVSEVASRVLDARLKAVCHWLPLAAENSEEDIEYVHQLRLSVRRAVEAARVFSGLIEDAGYHELREKLRHIRLAADEARNWDVLCGRLSHGGDIPAKLLKQIKVGRRKVQEPVVAAYMKYKTEAYGETFEKLVQDVESHRHGEGKQRFVRQARKYLRPVVKKFFKAAESDLTTDESLHALRIHFKKLGYTMEIVAVAFGPAFRKKLYPQVTLFQKLLGTMNDHATAKTLFADWLPKSEDVEQKAFLEGLLLAEERATDDLRAAFLATWTPKVVSRLKRQFPAYH
jgi:CHAD domain-containing protein